MAKKPKEKKLASSGKRVLTETDSKRVARGKDMYGYGEQKRPLNLSLTPKAIDILNKVANRRQLSKSELVEKWAREDLIVLLDTSESD